MGSQYVFDIDKAVEIAAKARRNIDLARDRAWSARVSTIRAKRKASWFRRFQKPKTSLQIIQEECQAWRDGPNLIGLSASVTSDKILSAGNQGSTDVFLDGYDVEYLEHWSKLS